MINAERGDDALLQLRARDLWQAGGGPSVGDGRVRPDMENFKSLTKIVKQIYRRKAQKLRQFFRLNLSKLIEKPPFEHQ